jgi:serine/threonine-protein kinase HipA
VTLTSKRDRDPASYLDIALAIADHGAAGRIGEDLVQLYRRVVFNVLTSHRDDHLRNHGFLRSVEGWRLAPAFDLNPVPGKPEHELTLDGNLRRADLAVVRQTAPFYRLADSEADAIINDVRAGLGAWRDEARAAGLGRQELDLLSAAIIA